jgi:apolipoprotein N-acyltransferase
VSRPLVLGASIASGALLWAASPAVGLGWVAWVALVPAAAVSLAAAGTRLGRLSVPLALVVYLELLLVPALPFGLAKDQWGEPVIPVLVAGSPVFVVALLAVPLAGLVLYLARFPLLLSVRGPGVVLVPAVAWTALDVVRTKFDPGGFWGPLYLSQHDTETAGLAALTGPWLLTFAIVTVNYALALAALDRRRLLPAVAVAAIFLAPGIALDRADGSRTVSVAAIQPGYDTAEFDRPVNRYLRRRFRDLERASIDLMVDLEPLTREAAARGAALIVWPEATVWVDPRENDRVRNRLEHLAGELGVTLIVPFFLRSESAGAAYVAGPNGPIGVHPKQRPMWFLGERDGDRTTPAPAETPAGPVGTLLGVDTQDPAWARRLVGSGAEILVSSTHDWAALARQQRAFASVHAAALHVPLVRADWRYGSAIVAAGGERTADAGLAKRRAVLVAEVRTGANATPYASWGDIIAWACVAALGALAVAASVGRLGRQRAEAERPAHALPEAELPAHPAP